MKREGQLWIRIFPDKPITKKPAEVRMGKGKGNPEGSLRLLRPVVFSSRQKAAPGSGSGSASSGSPEAAYHYQVHCKTRFR